MKKLSNIRTKKLLTSIALDAIQIAVLLGLMVYSQVVAMRVMIMCFPENCHKGTFGTFIAVFLVTVLCAVMLWMVLLMLDKYKVMIFGDSFPTFLNSGKSTSKKLAECVAHIPPPPQPKPFKEDAEDGKLEWHLFRDTFCVTNSPVVTLVFMLKHRKCACWFYPDAETMYDAKSGCEDWCVFIAWAQPEDLEKSALSVEKVRSIVSECESHLPQDREEDYFKNIWDHGM